MNDNTVVIEKTHVRAAADGDARQEEHPGFRIASLVARLVLGMVMLIAGAEKLGALEAFGANIYAYQLLPVEVVNIAALLFVWTEIAVGVLLVAGAAVRGSALVSSVMLVIFVVAIGSAMARGLDIDCGCFVGKGSGQSATVAASGATPGATTAGAEQAVAKEEPEKVGWPKIFEDLGLLALAIFLVNYPRSPLSVDQVLRREDAVVEESHTTRTRTLHQAHQ